MRTALVADEAGASDPRLDRSSEPIPAAANVVEGSCDAELVRRLGHADPAALSQLYARFARPCYSLARRICADQTSAEDVVQEVFLTLWREPTQFSSSRGDFATWLLTLVHHKAVDAARKEIPLRLGVTAALEAAEDRSATDATGRARLMAGQVGAALDRLPIEQRQALILAYFGGYTQHEIAVMTGVPLDTVTSRMVAAVQRLRSLLADQLDPGALIAEAHMVRQVANPARLGDPAVRAALAESIPKRRSARGVCAELSFEEGCGSWHDRPRIDIIRFVRG